jgi:exonuclease VII large subunit
MPDCPAAFSTFMYQMLCDATAFYTAQSWESLDAKISQLIEVRARENSILKFKAAHIALDLVAHECHERPEEGGALAEALQLSHELDRVAVVRKQLEKEVKAHTESNQKLRGDPRLRELKRRRQQVREEEKNIQQLSLANAKALRTLQYVIQRTTNEISLLEGELASLGGRVDLARAYTTESIASTTSASEFDEIPETVELDLGIAFDVPLF